MLETEEIDTYRDLKTAVDGNGGLATIKMRLLADVHGVGRLGNRVRDNISNKLDGEGLGHYPEPKLPSSQHKQVRIYSKGSPAGRLISAVLDPGHKSDEEIRRTINSDAEETLERVRELVCD